MRAALDLVDDDDARQPVEDGLGTSFQPDQRHIVFKVEVVFGRHLQRPSYPRFTRLSGAEKSRHRHGTQSACDLLLKTVSRIKRVHCLQICILTPILQA